MTISSMTGFARATGALGGSSWAWELKSVNGRALDVRLRLPSGFDALEADARQKLAKAISRGSVQAGLNLSETAVQAVAINQAVLEAYLPALKALSQTHGFATPNAAEVLGLRGVVEHGGADELSAALKTAVLSSLDDAISGLKAARAAEGAQLAAVLGSLVDSVAALASAAGEEATHQPRAVKERLEARLAEIMSPGAAPVDPDRLAQEVALLAAKADVREELDRLAVHVAAARDLLKSAEPVGRKLDFLAQEFHREATTLGNKAATPALKSLALELKTLIDQLKEQVQNVE
jgi:uncharacterized protein (TIGR00255 family)